VGHGLTSGDSGRFVTVVGVPEQSMNGTYKLSKIIPPDHIEYPQPGLPDVQPLVGGAVGIT
jgi:hypothetical protein